MGHPPNICIEFETYLLSVGGGDFSSQIPHQDLATGGCLALVAAVLHRAIWDLVDPGVQTHERRLALGWLRSNRRKKTGYSYLDCCELLNIDPQSMRKKLDLWLAEKKCSYRIQESF